MIALVAEHVIAHRMAWHFFDVIHHALVGSAGFLHGNLMVEGVFDEVHIGVVAHVPIGDK